MRRLALACGICIVFLPLAAAASPTGENQNVDSVAPVPSDLVAEDQGVNQRTVEVPTGMDKSEGAKAISFIDSPSATCYQPDPSVDECFINWYYLSVSADPNYMINMWVILNAFGEVSITQGFFQTSMYVPYNMHDRGFRVACGPPVPNPDPDNQPNHGNSYAYTIRARDSAGLKSANFGTVNCPAFTP